MKPRILHLSADYPDPFQPAKTKAISGLVEGTADQFDHLVVSINRQGGLAGLLRQGHVVAKDMRSGLIALRYAAPAAAVAISRPMDRLADWLTEELAEAGFKPDLIQAHKLTVEGVLAHRLAARLGVPFALTLQGNTDQKLLKQRPDRLPMMKQIWRDARAIMAFAPWTADWCRVLLGEPQRPVATLPCLLQNDNLMRPTHEPMLVRTAFNLDFWQNKNIAGLLMAVDRLTAEFPRLRLEIAGGGSASSIAKLKGLIRHHGLSARIELVGPVKSEAIQTWFNGATALALPSHRESFGMVFAEALLAGAPVIYPRGAAIDGFFQDCTFALGVVAKDPGDIANALRRLLVNENAVKSDLEFAQRAGRLDQFRRENVLEGYTAFLRQSLL